LSAVGATVKVDPNIQVSTLVKMVSNYIDNLIAHEAREQGRKRKYEEQQQQQKDNNQQINLLRNITKISSSKLAGQNCWTLGPDVLLKVQQKEEEDNQKKAAVENWK
jgi:hypothetical protein